MAAAIMADVTVDFYCTVAFLEPLGTFRGDFMRKPGRLGGSSFVWSSMGTLSIWRPSGLLHWNKDHRNSTSLFMRSYFIRCTLLFTCQKIMGGENRLTLSTTVGSSRANGTPNTWLYRDKMLLECSAMYRRACDQRTNAAHLSPTVSEAFLWNRFHDGRQTRMKSRFVHCQPTADDTVQLLSFL